MKKWQEDPGILSIAQSLQLSPQGNAVDSILYFCRTRINEWLLDHPTVKNIAELESLVCSKLHLTIFEFESEAELEQICDRYSEGGDPVFKTIPGSFDDETYATLLERRSGDKRSPDRYVALIDCRGAKAFRRFFTRWHEIAHVLSNGQQLLLQLCHRSTSQQNAEEKLMDAIAAEIGFYPEIFDPILRQEFEVEGRLTFRVVDGVRQQFCPEASFQSTLIACLKRSGVSVSYLECGLGLKAMERRQLESMQQLLLPEKAPEAKLRVLNSMKFGDAPRFHRNMSVPSTSLVAKSFEASPPSASENFAKENLAIWRHSTDKCLGYNDIFIEVRKLGDSKILALVSLSS